MRSTLTSGNGEVLLAPQKTDDNRMSAIMIRICMVGDSVFCGLHAVLERCFMNRIATYSLPGTSVVPVVYMVTIYQVVRSPLTSKLTSSIAENMHLLPLDVTGAPARNA